MGHLTRDRYPGGFRVGGGALYGGLALAREGGHEVVVRTAGNPVELDEADGFGAASRMISIEVEPTPTTATFRNVYGASGARTQFATHTSEALVPNGPVGADLLLLAPVLGEVELGLWLAHSGGVRTVALGAQGWFKSLGADAQVVHGRFPPLGGGVDVACMSDEDIVQDRGAPERLGAVVPVLAVTRGSAGATLYVHGVRSEVSVAVVADPVDPTGAGDVFAAVFGLALHEGASALDAAARAARASAEVIRGLGVSALV